MAKKTSSSSPGNDTILGKAKHLVRRFSWDMDDQPPPSNSGDDPEEDSLTPDTDSAITATNTTSTSPTPTAPIASLKRSTTVPTAAASPVQRHSMMVGKKERSEDVEYWKDLYRRRDKST